MGDTLAFTLTYGDVNYHVWHDTVAGLMLNIFQTGQAPEKVESFDSGDTDFYRGRYPEKAGEVGELLVLIRDVPTDVRTRIMAEIAARSPRHALQIALYRLMFSMRYAALGLTFVIMILYFLSMIQRG